MIKEKNGAYLYFGAHRNDRENAGSYTFRVYAPNADRVSLCADFCSWDEGIPMTKTENGEWTASAENVKIYDCYKYKITKNGQSFYKSDPCAFHFETPPGTASKIYDIGTFCPDDGYCLEKIKSGEAKIYKVDLSAFRRKDDGNPYSYREAAHLLAPFVKQNGYTHIELAPICEYFDSGIGELYPTGLFAPTSRFGTPCDFLGFIDVMHNAGVGVILGMPFESFSQQPHGLMFFDGGALYESGCVGKIRFDISKKAVADFLTVCAKFWLGCYRADGLRIYRNVCDKADDEFIKGLCTELCRSFPDSKILLQGMCG